MPATNFPSGITSYGIPVFGGGIPPTPGTLFFVDYTDGKDARNTKSLSANYALKTISEAYDRCTSNKFDTIVLVGNATHTLTSMLSFAKNRVNMIGIDGTTGRRRGQAAKVTLGVTTTATNIATIKNTGVRNSFVNIKFSNNDTVAEGLYSFAEGGEYTLIDSCEIYKYDATHNNYVTSCDLLMNGDSARVVNSTIGSTVNVLSTDNEFHARVLLSRETITGKVCRDTEFVNCHFLTKAGHTSNSLVHATGAKDAERLLLFDHCMFFNTQLATAVTADAVSAASNQTDGCIILNNCFSVNCTRMANTGLNIYAHGPTIPNIDAVGVADTDT